MLTILALIGTSFAQTTTYVWDGDSLDAALVAANGASGAQVIRIGPSASPYLVNDRDYKGVNITLEAIVPGTVTIGRANSGDTRLFKLKKNGSVQTLFRFVGVNFAYGSGTRAVKLNDGSELEFEGVIVAPYAGTSDFDGGAIKAQSTATVTITNSSFGASNARNGGHIYLKNDASLTITDSAFADASISSGDGGSIFAEAPTNTLTISGSVFSNNTATSSLGGAIATSGPLSLSGNHFEGNSAGYGGAIYADEEVHIDSTVFCLNDASIAGGAVRVRSFTTRAYSNTVQSSLFLNNRSPAGGAVTYLLPSYSSSYSRTNTLDNNSFVRNTDTGSGGADVDMDLLNTDTFNANNNLHAYGIGTYAFYNPTYGLSITDTNLQEWSGPSSFSNVSGDPVATSHDPGFSAPTAGTCDPLSARPTNGGTVGAFAAGAFPDGDGDGFVGAQDCDDADPTVHKGAADTTCDGKDNDCNGRIDDGVADANLSPFYFDADEDGYGGASHVVMACDAPTSFSATNDDCDDTNVDIHPGAPEICGNGIDEDCSGAAGVNSTWYSDSDGDGYGDPLNTTSLCADPGVTPGTGWVDENTDCDDDASTTYPGAPELCDGIDQDCGGDGDLPLSFTTYTVDGDGDGYGSNASGVATSSTCDGVPPAGYALSIDDCDDDASTTYPGAPELCDGIDQDCGGDGDVPLSFTTYTVDGDGDGYGSSASGAATMSTCDGVPAGFAVSTDDCDDTDSGRFPGNLDVCTDAIDNDCTGTAATTTTWFLDNDNDTFGAITGSRDTCDDTPTPPPEAGTWISRGLDCDDNNPAVNPDADETCEAGDQNCDGFDDPAVLPTWWPDVDQDSFGDSTAIASITCNPTAGSVQNNDDCNDANPNQNPNVPEVCDGIDNNCDGANNEGLLRSYYPDDDVDGYGSNTALPLASCPEIAEDFLVEDNTDCNDSIPSIYPGAPESCDGVDQDCGNDGDLPIAFITYTVDGDGDGYGSDASGAADISTCDTLPPAGYALSTDDCDDGAADVHPDAPEQCDPIDHDCDGDPNMPTGQAPLWFLDTDGDGYGAGNPTEQCDAPVGDYVLLDGDCDETDPAIHPGAAEACDAVDHDCDGDTTNDVPYFNLWPDTDGDGFGDASANTTAPVCVVEAGQSTNALDCNDTDAAIHPDAVDDTCDNDSDCDGQIGEDSPPVSGFLDADGDGYGGVTPLVGLQCPNIPVSATNDDCDDQNPDWNPTADEICGNAFDENCDGVLAEAEQWWPDTDGDGYGAGDGVLTCTPPAGYVNDNTDCDDTDDTIHPEQTEECDAVDHDCDGESDNGLTRTWYLDADGDGFGDPEEPLDSCEEDLAGYVSNSTDCDDQNIAINPDAEELCDSIDHDCDGEADNGNVCANPISVTAAADAGCGCQSSPAGLGWVFLGLPLLLARRRAS